MLPVSAAEDWSSSSSSRFGLPHAAALLSVLAGSLYWSLSSDPAQSDARSVNSKAWLARAVNRAAASGELGQLQQLLASHKPSEGVNLAHPNGWTPLLAAAANGHEPVVRWLLAEGADVNAKDKYAVTRRNLSTELLKSRGEFHADINPRVACLGWTPLHYAVAFQHLRLLPLLLAAGADMTAKTADGDDPINCIEWEMLDGGGAVRKEVEKMFDDERARRAVLQRQREKEERLRNPLELKLRQSMVGQLMPIYSVSSAIRRRENGW